MPLGGDDGLWRFGADDWQIKPREGSVRITANHGQRDMLSGQTDDSMSKGMTGISPSSRV